MEQREEALAAEEKKPVSDEHAGATYHRRRVQNVQLKDKGNGQPGLKGRRQLHLDCPYWSSFYAAVLGAGTSTDEDWRPWYYANRPSASREGAMLTQRAIGWRLIVTKLDHLNDLKDMTNAFACCTIDDMDKFFREKIIEA